MSKAGELRRGSLVVSLLVVGTLFVIEARRAVTDLSQCLGMLGGGLGLGAAALLMRDSVLKL